MKDKVEESVLKTDRQIHFEINKRQSGINSNRGPVPGKVVTELVSLYEILVRLKSKM